MSKLQFATGSYDRGDGLSKSRLVNMYVEAMPNAETKRIPRPGLVKQYMVGSGPVTPIWQSGIFGDDVFAVSGPNVYRGQSLLGTVPLGTVRWDSSDTQLVIVSGGQVWCYDGTTFAQVTIPNGALISDVVFLSEQFFYYELNSDQIYYSALGDATSVDTLSVFDAETSPDPTVGGATLYGQLWAFGKQTVEIFTQTGTATNPMENSPGQGFSRGCIAQLTIRPLDNSLFWVGDDLVVYRVAGVPVRVSTHFIESKLRASSDPTMCSAFTTTFDGHPFYVLTIPGVGTYVYDVANPPEWAEWSSFGQTTFRARAAILINGTPWLGDTDTGTVWTFDSSVATDDGDTMERVASLAVEITGGTQRCNNLMVNGSRGVGPVTNTVPVVDMAYSDDQSRTWSDWLSEPVGAIGDYGVKPIWRALGLMESPGRDILIRMTDPVVITLKDAVMNEWNR